ncbi:MAG: hypothetical protein A2014_12130 [Spirochaetes bacterium GWF1_49_6]|nr:MAG: hypothetical protein A2014_12130 [Spirochaetes bacterium GWF1_49_6]
MLKTLIVITLYLWLPVTLLLSCGSSSILIKEYENPESLLDKSPKNMIKSLPEMPKEILIPMKGNIYESTIDRVQVEGIESGLPEGVQQVYLSLFIDHSHNVEIQRDFDKILKDKLTAYGLQIMNKIKYAQVVVSGSINTFFIEDSRLVTNIPGLVYTMKVTYSVQDMEGNPVQENKSIEQSYLVVDTNSYVSNMVVPQLVNLMATRTAEAIVYGWQLQFSQFNGKVDILGEYHENGLLTNRP